MHPRVQTDEKVHNIISEPTRSKVNQIINRVHPNISAPYSVLLFKCSQCYFRNVSRDEPQTSHRADYMTNFLFVLYRLRHAII